MKPVAIVLCALVLSSCATLFTGTKDTITFSSNPRNAEVYINGIYRAKTPCELEVSKKGTTVAALKLEGMQDETFQLDKKFNPVTLVNLLGPIIIGFAIDIATGAVHSYQPKYYNINLSGKTDDGTKYSVGNLVTDKNLVSQVAKTKAEVRLAEAEVEKTKAETAILLADAEKARAEVTLAEAEKAKKAALAPDPEVGQAQYRGGGDPLKGLNISEATKKLVKGNYYALLIGIDKYQGIWSPLKNAVNDARVIENLLRSSYGFNKFITLYDEEATRSTIIEQLEWLVENVKKEDNVFIYYSGHGEYKENIHKGFWVPYDAPSKSVSGYISNNDIQAFLSGIESKHTLLISDACFSGDIFRGTTMAVPFENSEKYYNKVHHLVSRKAITSGGLEPVMDGGREGHSVFAYYLIKSLRNNSSKYYDASQLFHDLKIPVVNNSEQSPRFEPIKNTGDEGGQFIFIKK
jgi:hypothetical protein